jgi:hypothetical protein
MMQTSNAGVDIDKIDEVLKVTLPGMPRVLYCFSAVAK